MYCGCRSILSYTMIKFGLQFLKSKCINVSNILVYLILSFVALLLTTSSYLQCKCVIMCTLVIYIMEKSLYVNINMSIYVNITSCT